METLEEDLSYVRRKFNRGLAASDQLGQVLTEMEGLRKKAYKMFASVKPQVRNLMKLWFLADLEAFNYNFYEFARVYKPYFLRMADAN